MGIIYPNSIAGGGIIRATVSTPLLLDLVTGAGAAYSLRKVKSGYSGNAIRVRRSSDNAEADIGFDSSGNLNTTALLAHVGAGNGFVTTWYDQSGNARDISHSTASAQPRIVNAGAIDTQNSKPSILFNGTSQYLFDTSPFMYAAGAASYLTVLSQSATTNRFICTEGSSASANQSYRIMGSDGGTGSNIQFAVINDAGTNLINSALGGTTGTYNSTLNQVGVVDTGSGVTGYLNAVAGTGASYTRSGTLTLDRFAIGCVIRPVPGGFFNGSISEVIIHPSALSTPNRQTIEANQKTYFGTP
jgi:hypothetical protein